MFDDAADGGGGQDIVDADVNYEEHDSDSDDDEGDDDAGNNGQAQGDEDIMKVF